MKQKPKEIFYVAYGSNLNIRQMQARCPTAKLYAVGEIRDYELQFKGMPDHAYATIAPQKGSSVPAAVWKIQPMDEWSLDRYEGYPNHYFKEIIPVQIGETSVDAMVYIMNLKMDFGVPTDSYYKTVRQGYRDCGLDTDILDEAVHSSMGKFYSSLDEDDDEFFPEDDEEQQSFGMEM